MIDNYIVIFYLFCLFFITIYFRSKSGSLSDYIKIGNNFASSRIVFVAAIFTTSVGGGTTFGLPEKVYQGKLYYPAALILVIIVDLMIAKYIVPRLKTFDAQTVGDVLLLYYGKVGKFFGGLATILISIGYMTVQMYVCTYIFEFFMQIGHFQSMVLSYGIILLFNLLGGVKSIFANHVLQFFAIIIAIPIIFVLGINYIGTERIISFINSESHNLTIAFDYNLLFTIISFSIMSFHPSLVQRVMLSKDVKTVRNAIYIKSGIYAILLILITFNGIFSKILDQDMVAWQALPFMINTIIPVGLKGLVIIGLIASVISTADSELNIASLSLTNDVFINLFKIDNKSTIFFLARIFTLLFAILGIMTSLYFTNIIDIVIFAAGFWAPVILVPTMFALYGISVSLFFFVLSSCSGLFAFLGWQIFFKPFYDINSVIIGFAVSLIIFLIGIVLSKKRIHHDTII
jgi:SSS family solute:Na+ symporter